jgi:signal transduction histidine kinase
VIDRVPAAWHRLDVTVRDLPIGLALLAASLLPGFASQGTQLGGLPARPFDALAVVVIALQCLPLAVRRRWPAVCLALVSLGFAVDQLRGYHSVAGTALPIALLSAGAHLPRLRRATVGVFSAAYALLVVAFLALGGGEPPGEIVTFYLVLGLAWGIGAWLRRTRAAEAELRGRIAEDTRAAERTRIARELHDVVTHHVTAMVVQAEAARYLTTAPDRLDQALTAVTDTGRHAISDLRHLLELLNPDHGTEPPFAGLGVLVEQARRAGQPVELVEEGTPTSTGRGDLVAYRVAQEGLTNALKHAHGSRTSLRVHRGEEEITVEIGTAGSGAPVRSPAGSGRGLAGLRERVDDLGGDFTAGPRPGGGFFVRARIPTGGRS